MNIQIDLTYRDGGNYKSYDEPILSNKNKISLEEVTKTMKEYEFPVGGFVPGYYGLPTIAGMECEFLPANGDDHSYMSLVDEDIDEAVSATTEQPNCEVDISDFLEVVRRKADKEKEEALKEAISYHLKGAIELMSKCSQTNTLDETPSAFHSVGNVSFFINHEDKKATKKEILRGILTSTLNLTKENTSQDLREEVDIYDTLKL